MHVSQDSGYDVPQRRGELCSALNLEVQREISSNFGRLWIATECLDNEFILVVGEHLVA